MVISISCFTLTWQDKRAPCFNSFLEKWGVSVGNASPPPDKTWHSHCIQVPPPPQADGKNIPYTTTNTKYSEEKEGLSSVEIASNSVVPIAGTGINVATTYLRVGTEQFDLSPYFDYNKEYLSFPLTDIADSLYFAVDSDTVSTNTDEISLGVTWEEQ